MGVPDEFSSNNRIRGKGKLWEEDFYDFVVDLNIKSQVLPLHNWKGLIVLEPISQGIDSHLPYLSKLKFSLYLP